MQASHAREWQLTEIESSRKKLVLDNQIVLPLPRRYASTRADLYNAIMHTTHHTPGGGFHSTETINHLIAI